MKKIVNVRAVYPISGVSKITRGTLTKVEMSTDDIYRCLCGRATVVEVIGDKLIPLNFDNYDKNNAPKEKIAVIPTAPVKVVIPKPVTEVKSNLNVKPEVVEDRKTEEIVKEDKVEETSETTTEEAVTEGTSNDETVEENVTEDEVISSDEETEENISAETTSSTNQTNNYSRKKHRR